MFPRLHMTILTVFFILGVFLVYVPLHLRPLDKHWKDTLIPVFSYSGALVSIAGALLSLSGSYYLLRRGAGPSFVLTPPQKLVVACPYAHLQHPILLGGLAILIGEALWLWSLSIMIYSVLLALVSHYYVVRVEEPRLRQKFGTDYHAYQRAVPRWFPHVFERKKNSQ